MPRAEREKDLQSEAEIVSYVISLYPQRYDGFMKIDTLGYRLDGVLTKRHAFGYAEAQLFYEAKDRYIGFQQFPDFIVSQSKVEAALAMTEATTMRSCLFARFTDGIIASLDFGRYQGNCRFGGRQDRLQGKDIFVHDNEVLAVFQWGDFVILRDKQP